MFKRFAIASLAFASFTLAAIGETAPVLKAAEASPRQVLERLGEAWQTINDFQAVFVQIETQPDGARKQFQVHAKVVQEIRDDQRSGTLRLDFYDEDIPISALAGPAAPATPVVVYYVTPQRLFYTFKPRQNSYTIQWLEDSGPLPEFLQLAGLADFDMEKLKERVYVNETVYLEPVDGVETYRLHFFPKEEWADIEPDRFLWVERDSYLPKRFETPGDYSLIVQFRDVILNQNLLPQDIVPRMPRNMKRYDLREQKTRGQ